MSFDLSRIKFNPLDDYFGVIMQQGRVQLDADWNTMVSQFSRRMQAGSLDTFGPAVVPRETPEGFLVTGPVASFKIGPGRIYADGLLAENHTDKLKWDARLAEVSGTAKLSGADLDAAPSGLKGTTKYKEQPYYPYPPDLPANKNCLVYVDVWQRDISYLQDASLVDAAVGVDTTARQQTVWQVKYLDDVGNIDTATADADIPGWLKTIHPSSARLSTDTGALTDDDNPCLLPPQAGYKGIENQLYRVQVHEGGTAGNATFKWSRDNAVIASRVSAIPSGNELVVDSLGRDDVLGFHEGDWVEITDDYRELMGLPGEIRRIRLGAGIDSATRTITLQGAALPTGSGPGQFPVDGSHLTKPERNTRLIRWDQGGIVFRENETEYTDLDASTSKGVIKIPSGSTRLFLEKGILVDFDLEDVVDEANFKPEFKTGDYWVFAARVNDASVEVLDRAAPHGIHHHYAKLAIINNGNIIDCRELWPPETGGESCACTVCVHPEGHNNGSATIQQAIDQVVAAGGGTVCLAIGKYQVSESIRITGNSVTLRGQGWQTMLLASKPDSLVEIGGKGVVTDIAVEGLLGITSAVSGSVPAVNAKNVLGLKISHCLLANFAGTRKWGDSLRRGTSQAIKLTGVAAMARIENCKLFAEHGIVGPNQDEEFLGTYDLSVTRCLLSCPKVGIGFNGLSYHLNKLDITGNYINGASSAGIELTGVAAQDAAVALNDNLLSKCGNGIRAAVSNLRILGNDINGERRGESDKDFGSAIMFVDGLDPAKLDQQQTIGNRISNYDGHAINIETAAGNMMVKQNQVRNIKGAGFVIGTGGSAEFLSLENNQFTDIDGLLPTEKGQHAAILLQACVRADVANNILNRVVRHPETAKSRAGIQVSSCARMNITGNHLLAVTPANFAGLGAGIALLSEVGSFNVSNNEISRVPEHEGKTSEQVIDASWIPLFVKGARPELRKKESETTSPADEPGRMRRTGPRTGRRTDEVLETEERENEFSALKKAVASTPVYGSKKRAYAMAATHIVDLGRAALQKNDICINDNKLDGTSSSTTSVYVTVAKFCGLENNEIISFYRGPLVRIMADHAAVNHNRLMASADDILIVYSDSYVVMGNLRTTGNIKVLKSGAVVVLPPPWDALNVLI